MVEGGKMRIAMLVLVALTAAAACTSAGAGGSDSSPAGEETVPETKPGDHSGSSEVALDLPVTTPGLPFLEMYELIMATAESFEVLSGDWLEDFGDAAYYGPAFYANAALDHDNPAWLDRALGAHQRNLDVLILGTTDAGYFFDQLEEIMMAALGVIEVIGVVDDAQGLAELDAALELIAMTVEGFGYYLEVDIETYAMGTFGPTTNSAAVALLFLRYAEWLDTPRSNQWAETGTKMLAETDKQAWTGSEYLFAPDNQKLHLYPNISMMVANVTAFRVTGKKAYLDRAIAAYAGIQPLKDHEKKCYRSPYSAEYMGAQTEDYSTLSSQNYTMMALALLFRETSDAAYRDEITDIAAFIEEYLLVDGRLLHHWMDGKVAVPDDPEYFCTGCNLQFLFVAFYAQRFVYGEQDGPR
jgi:hypothetical protein